MGNIFPRATEQDPGNGKDAQERLRGEVPDVVGGVEYAGWLGNCAEVGNAGGRFANC